MGCNMCRYTFESDVWSAGVCLFEALFGHSPFGTAAVQGYFDIVESVTSVRCLEIPKAKLTDGLELTQGEL